MPTIRVLLLMLPHSGTLLLEGEGYILVALFGLPDPDSHRSVELGGTPLTSLGPRALAQRAGELRGDCFAVAAWYEATEVIWMNG